MSSPENIAHVRAESPFVDDLPEPRDLLHLAVCGSPVAHGTIRRLDIAPARTAPGVAAVLTAKDIPGENQVGTIIRDEPLLAEDAVHYAGQAVAVVAAESPEQARAAVALIDLEIEPLPVTLDPREAAARGELIAPARTLNLGDVDEAWERCAMVVSGRVESGGQEHVYLETQASLAIPEARDRLRIHAGTQAPSLVQRVVAGVLGCRMNDLAVEVHRLGGAFGGKEDQATPWAALAALTAHRLQRPAKLVLRRHEDMRMTGKRHPYSTDYRLGIDAEGKLIAFEAVYYQNSGAAADLSPAILERTLFHSTNSYSIPNVRVTGMCCRTNLPPFTAFRGFGGPQAMFVIESAITAAAEASGIPERTLQQANLLTDGDQFPYGMQMSGEAPTRSFETARSQFDVEERARAIMAENAESPFEKRGLAMMPVCFGISFTNTMLNQAGALVHIYNDGSVSVSTAAVEMGQGVQTKVRRIVAVTLGIDEELVRIESTSTTRVANMSPTAASTATDLNGAAARMACKLLRDRLKPVAAELGDSDWAAVVQAAYAARIDLSAHAFYATPNLHYDKQTETGNPFAYHVCGTAVVEASVDVLRGTATVESVRVIHDAGRSLDLLVDRGQAEGAIVQGIGWMTLEELVHNADGILLSGSLATYKIPDLEFAPHNIEVVFMEDSQEPGAVMQTKAIGEPPFMYGIGAYFAIRDALRAADCDLPADLFEAPLTNERILQQLEKQ